MSGAHPRIRNPDFTRDIAASFERQPVLRALGVSLDHLSPGTCRLLLPVAESLLQQHDSVHGGIVGLIADVAGCYAAMTLFAPGQDVVTVEYKINFLSPAAGHVLHAEGRVLRAGRRLAVSTVEVRAHDAHGNASLCAAMQLTCMPSDAAGR